MLLSAQNLPWSDQPAHKMNPVSKSITQVAAKRWPLWIANSSTAKYRKNSYFLQAGFKAANALSMICFCIFCMALQCTESMAEMAEMDV